MRKGVLSEQQPDHAHAQAHWLQAVPMRPLRQGLPAKGGSTPSSRGSTSGSAGARLSLAADTVAATAATATTATSRQQRKPTLAGSTAHAGAYDDRIPRDIHARW